MKKVLVLFFITLLFLSNCAQNVGVKIDPEFDPEVRIVSDQTYPEIKTSEYLQKLTIEGKDYGIFLRDGREMARIPRKYLKNIDNFVVKAAGQDLWNFNYSDAIRILEAEPKNYKVDISLLRQNPENYDNERPFMRDDLAKVDVYYKDLKLVANRYLSEQGRPDLIQLKIPTFPEVSMDDYSVKVDLPGYEPYNKKLIDIQNKTIKLKLRQSMLKLKFVNMENAVYEPGFVCLKNKYNKTEKYSSRELKSGISVYDVEFPVKLYSQKNAIAIFDDKGNQIDTLLINNAGFFDLLFKENLREFPAVFYDLSEGKADPQTFEKWVNAKKNSSEGVFLYVTNGYEKISNSNPDNIINVTNKIYRITPRTSNVLESLKNFTDSFQGFAGDANLNDEEVYGNKMTPRYYIFLADENVERLQFAVDKLVQKMDELKMDKNRVIIYINKSQEKSSIINQLKNNNLNVQIL